MDIVIKRERLGSIIPELVPLLEAHFAEASDMAMYSKMDPDWPRYLVADANDQFFMFTARVDGKLIGYAGFWVYFHSHCKTVKVASEDLYYVEPKSRRGLWAAMKLFRFSEAALRAVGCKRIRLTQRKGLSLEGFFGRNGYSVSATEYVKDIGESQNALTHAA